MNWKYEDGRIYSLDEQNNLIAEVTYVQKEDGEIDIDEVYVNPEFRGQGIAGKAMEETAEFLRKKGLKTTATCSYANSWLKKNKERYADIISDDLYSEAIACKIDTKH